MLPSGLKCQNKGLVTNEVKHYPSIHAEKESSMELKIRREELHQLPGVGDNSLPDHVGAMEAKIDPNYHVLWQVISNLTLFLFRDESPAESVYKSDKP